MGAENGVGLGPASGACKGNRPLDARLMAVHGLRMRAAAGGEWVSGWELLLCLYIG